MKESRAIRPRLSRTDSPFERAEKNKILHPPRDSSVGRKPVDRCELYLALFGFDGWSYVLTFRDEDLPPKYKDVQKCWQAMLRGMKAWHGEAFDYLYSIEGKHGDHRWHIHVTVRYSEFPPLLMEDLWRFGAVEKGAPLLIGPYDSYRRTAKYYCKESTDGVKIPIGRRSWVASQHLRAQLPPAQYFTDDSGYIPTPGACRVSGGHEVHNEWGWYRYSWFIKKEDFCTK